MQLPETSKSVRLMAQKMCDSLTETLSRACSSKWQVELSDQVPGKQPDVATSIWLRCRFEGSCDGDALLAFPAAVLPKLSLRDVTGDGSDLQTSQKAALLAVLEGGLSNLGTLLDETGSTLIRIEGVEGTALTGERVIELLVQSVPKNPETAMSLYLCLSQTLITAVQGSIAESFVFPDAADSEAANLDLVMGVELNVKLRFGQRQLALREVMELASGSVVELDRQVDEPVELILDGRVVARGEAVIVDGNYGMRVTQLVSDPFL